MSNPMRIDICICTFQRAEVVNTLATLAAMSVPDGCRIRIIIADNDEVPSAQPTIADAAMKYGLDITYVHAPARNISIARNACLDAVTGEYAAFIDDDQLVASDWLTEIYHTARETKSAVTLGPVLATYAEDAPDWIKHSNFHCNLPAWVNGELKTGYTGNVLLNMRDPAFKGQRFNESFGITGGEDTDFFSRVYAAGGRIAYTERARIFEPVPNYRATLPWLLQRRARYGETHARVMIASGKPLIRNATLALLKAGVCYAMMLPNSLQRLARGRWQLRAQLHRSVATTLWKARA